MIGAEIEISTRACNPSIHLILLGPGSASSGRDRTPTVFISEVIRSILYNFLDIAIVEVAKADSNHLSRDRKPLFQPFLQSKYLHTHTHSHSRYLKYCNAMGNFFRIILETLITEFDYFFLLYYLSY